MRSEKRMKSHELGTERAEKFIIKLLEISQNNGRGKAIEYMSKKLILSNERNTKQFYALLCDELFWLFLYSYDNIQDSEKIESIRNSLTRFKKMYSERKKWRC